MFSVPSAMFIKIRLLNFQRAKLLYKKKKKKKKQNLLQKSALRYLIVVTRPKSKTKPFIAHRVPTSWAAPSCDLSRLAAPALSTAERTSIREILKLRNLNWILPSVEVRMVRITKKIQVRGGFEMAWNHYNAGSWESYYATVYLPKKSLKEKNGSILLENLKKQVI